jgi:1-acyl-sn-glycerol-3-phosphate acyltransferase
LNFIGLIAKIIFRMNWEGVELLPNKNQKLIIVCNHTNYFDPIALAMGVPARISFLAKSELVDHPMGWFIKGLGAIAIDRGKGDKDALQIFAKRSCDGWWLGMFPEGTRHRDGVLGKPKSGMSLVAKMTKSDILPCAIVYDGPLRFGCHVTVRYGKVIPYAELGLEENSTRALKNATSMIWDEVKSLRGELAP